MLSCNPANLERAGMRLEVFTVVFAQGLSIKYILINRAFSSRGAEGKFPSHALTVFYLNTSLVNIGKYSESCCDVVIGIQGQDQSSLGSK